MKRTLQRLAPYRSLLTGLAAASLAWAFLALGGEMLEGDTHAFDTAILRAAQALRLAHPWVADAMRDLSGLGSPTVLALVTAFAAGYLAVVRARRGALLLAASVITGALAVSGFKALFGRPRPSAEFAELVAPGLSYPSGHASMSAIVFLSVATLLASTRTRTAERGYILVTAALMTVLVGVSRIALGVHWATDVVGGWGLGTAWALAWLLVARWLARAQPGTNADRAG